MSDSFDRNVLEAALRDLGPHVAYPEHSPAPTSVLDFPWRPGAALPRQRRTWPARVAVAVAALAIGMASFAFLWTAFRPAPPSMPSPAIPAGWSELRRGGATLFLPPGAESIDRPGAWVRTLREAGLPASEVRGWRETTNAFVLAATLPDGGSLLLWHPRPAAPLNGWATARALAGVTTTATRTDRAASTLDGRDAIALTFSMPDGSTHVGYRMIAAGDTWNLSFVASGPDGGSQLATFQRVVETFSIASGTTP